MTVFAQHKPLLIVAAVAALTLVSAGSVLAQEATPDQFRAQALTGTAQRADVLAAAAAFRASGEKSPWSRDYVQRVATTQPRAVVKAETLRALKNHEVLSAGEFYSIAPAQPVRMAGVGR